MNIVILGRPGAGKGTQAKLIEDHFGLVHLSTGDLLRSAQSQDTNLAREISQRIDRGNFVSDELIMSVVEQELSRRPSKGYIFDGIPRTENQAQLLDDLLEKLGLSAGVVIELRIDAETARQRLLDRGQKEHRKDDNAETIAHRLEVYKSETEPLIRHYQTSGKLTQIDGAGSPKAVFGLIRELIDQTSAS